MSNALPKIDGLSRRSIRSLFDQLGLESDVDAILEIPSMYPYKEDLESNWSYYAACAFSYLARLPCCSPESLGIIGIGNGVEALAAAASFPSLQGLWITDIDEEVVVGARQNIVLDLSRRKINLQAAVGSLCEPLEYLRIKLDLLYANIPNLLVPAEKYLIDGEEKGTFLSAALLKRYSIPSEFIRWALAVQYSYLIGARSILNPGGSVLTAIGGRVPDTLLGSLFERCGYSLEEVCVGFKLQTETLIDLLGYQQLESKYGVKFSFYPFAQCQQFLKCAGLSNPTREVSSKEITRLLSPYCISATEALSAFQLGMQIGHTVVILRGALQD